MALNNNKVPSTDSDGTLYVLDEEYFTWARKGTCAEYDAYQADIFFTQGASYELAAKMICGTCQVKAECLSFALKYTVDGIWGGTDAKERRKIQLREGRKGIKLPTLNLSA